MNRFVDSTAKKCEEWFTTIIQMNEDTFMTVTMQRSLNLILNLIVSRIVQAITSTLYWSGDAEWTAWILEAKRNIIFILCCVCVCVCIDFLLSVDTEVIFLVQGFVAMASDRTDNRNLLIYTPLRPLPIDTYII